MCVCVCVCVCVWGSMCVYIYIYIACLQSNLIYAICRKMVVGGILLVITNVEVLLWNLKIVRGGRGGGEEEKEREEEEGNRKTRFLRPIWR